jgi:hypothetical protein
MVNGQAGAIVACNRRDYGGAPACLDIVLLLSAAALRRIEE